MKSTTEAAIEERDRRLDAVSEHEIFQASVAREYAARRKNGSDLTLGSDVIRLLGDSAKNTAHNQREAIWDEYFASQGYAR